MFTKCVSFYFPFCSVHTDSSLKWYVGVETRFDLVEKNGLGWSCRGITSYRTLSEYYPFTRAVISHLGHKFPILLDFYYSCDCGNNAFQFTRNQFDICSYILNKFVYMCICAKAVAVLEQNFLGQQSSYFIAQCDGQYWSWRSMLELLSWKHRETAICLLIADVFRYQCLSPLIVWLTVLQTICVFEWLQVGVCHSTLYSKNSLAYLKMQPTYNLFWVGLGLSCPIHLDQKATIMKIASV